MTSVGNTSEPLQLPQADAYIFDIDGTLLVARDLVHWSAFQQAMREAYGVDATIDAVPYHGMTDRSILRAALALKGIADGAIETNLGKALEVMCREAEANRAQFSIQICPGIESLLQKLQHQGRLLGIASGNLESIGWRKIEAAGLRDFFSFGSFSDFCESRAGIFQNAIDHVKAQLGARSRSCFIGDTPHDVRAAREVGGSIVAVASGTFSFDQLNACAPDVCIPNCGDLFSARVP